MEISKEEVFTLYQQVIDINGESAHIERSAVAFYHKEQIALLSGKLPQIIAVLKNADRHCTELGIKQYFEDVLRRLLRTELLLSAMQFNAGELEGAMPRLLVAEKICRYLDAKQALTRTLGHIAFVFRRRGALDEAYKIFQEEEALCRELSDNDGLAYALLDQARILCDKNQTIEGLARYAEAEAAARNSGNNESLYLALYNTAYFSFFQNQDLNHALSKCREALSLTDKLTVYKHERSNALSLLEEIEAELQKHE